MLGRFGEKIERDAARVIRAEIELGIDQLTTV